MPSWQVQAAVEELLALKAAKEKLRERQAEQQLMAAARSRSGEWELEAME